MPVAKGPPIALVALSFIDCAKPLVGSTPFAIDIKSCATPSVSFKGYVPGKSVIISFSGSQAFFSPGLTFLPLPLSSIALQAYFPFGFGSVTC